MIDLYVHVCICISMFACLFYAVNPLLFIYITVGVVMTKNSFGRFLLLMMKKVYEILFKGQNGSVSYGIYDRVVSKFKRIFFLHLKNNQYSILQFQVTAREIASIIGQIISMSFALGNICHIMIRNLHWSIRNRIGWDQKINFTQSALNELMFWFNNCDSLPFKSISTACT